MGSYESSSEGRAQTKLDFGLGRGMVFHGRSVVGSRTKKGSNTNKNLGRSCGRSKRG